MKFSENVGNGPMNKWLKFGGDMDHCLKTGIVFRIHYYWRIRKAVNGHSFILICHMVALVRRALAEVCTVPVLPVSSKFENKIADNIIWDFEVTTETERLPFIYLVVIHSHYTQHIMVPAKVSSGAVWYQTTGPGMEEGKRKRSEGKGEMRLDRIWGKFGSLASRWQLYHWVKLKRDLLLRCVCRVT